jgi:AI-2 transport protein TqsA
MEKETLIPKPNLANIFYVMGILVIVIFTITYFSNLFKPLVIAFLLWFIINQLRFSIRRLKIMGRSLSPLTSNVLSYLIIFFVSYLAAKLLMSNIEGIIESMPVYLENLNNKFSDTIKILESPKYEEYLQKLVAGIDIEAFVKKLAMSLTSLMANSAVVIFYLIFFLLEETAQKVKMDKLFPEKSRQYERFTQNLENIAKSIRYYIGSMTAISILTGAVSYVVLLVMHVDYAFLWSFIIFILNFIPYIGPLISSLLPAIFAFLISGDPMKLIWVFLAMEGVQVVFGNFVQPLVMGKGSNLSTIVVLISLAFWGMIWGVVGMILAIPVTSVAVIILSQIPSTRFIAIILSEKGEINEIA